MTASNYSGRFLWPCSSLPLREPVICKLKSALETQNQWNTNMSGKMMNP